MTDDFQKYLELDLKGQLSPDDPGFAILEEDLQLWRDSLVAKAQELDRQFTERRAASLLDRSRLARINYESWRKSACGYKEIISSRLRDVKAWLKEQNQEEHGNTYQTTNLLLEKIVVLLESIERKMP